MGSRRIAAWMGGGLCIFLALLGGCATGGQAFYRVDAAPYIQRARDSAFKEAAVYLVESTHVRVLESGLTHRQHQLVVKVLNPKGVGDFRTQPVAYAPDRQKVEILLARVIKPDGSMVEAREREGNLVEPWIREHYPAGAKMVDFTALAPGDVLELLYRVEDTVQDGLPPESFGDVVDILNIYPKLRFEYRVELPRERSLYSNASKLEGLNQAREELEGGRTLYRYMRENVPKVEPEPGSPGWAEIAPPLHVSTSQTWEQVSRSWWGLVKDRLTPKKGLRQTVEKVLQGVDRKDGMAVIRALYTFVATEPHFVDLEFGLRGYKPSPVEQVLSRRLGDRQDKACLLAAMLKVAGVDSRLVLLRERSLGRLPEDVASLAAFNHVVVYVPQYQLFLDGTAGFSGPRELPSRNRRATALIIEPDGTGTLVTTPEAKAEENATRMTWDVKLQPDGGAQVLGTLTVSGQQAAEYRRTYGTESGRKASFQRAWEPIFPGLTMNEVKLNDLARLDEDVAFNFQVTIPRYAEVLPGGVLRFLPFGVERPFQQAYAMLEERRFDLVMQGPWQSQSTLRYTLPAGYTVGELPPTLAEEHPWGQVRLTYRQEGDRLIAEAELLMPMSRIPVDYYPEFRSFLGRVDQGFGRKVVLRPGAR